MYVRPSVERNRSFFLFLGMTLACILMAAGILALIPRHKDVPFIVEINAKTGLPVNRPLRIEGVVTANHLMIQYFAARWVRNLLTMNPALTVSYIDTDYAETMGAGSEEMEKWEKTHQLISKMEKHPGTHAEVHIMSTSFMGDGNIFIRALQNVHAHNATSSRHWNCTMQYRLVPPQTVQEAYQNPIGFHISEFTCTRSLSSS